MQDEFCSKKLQLCLRVSSKNLKVLFVILQLIHYILQMFFHTVQTVVVLWWSNQNTRFSPVSPGTKCDVSYKWFQTQNQEGINTRISLFIKNLILRKRLMTSHQMSFLKNKQFFENVENLLKLTVDKFYDKFLSCLITRIVVFY